MNSIRHAKKQMKKARPYWESQGYKFKRKAKIIRYSLKSLLGDYSTKWIYYCFVNMNGRKVHDHTKKRYAVFIRFLQDRGKIISFSDCNVSKVRAMDEFLHKQGKAQCTIYDCHKYLKLFINDAMTDGLLEQNPYKFLPFHIGKGEKQYVDCCTEEQFNDTRKLDLSTPHLPAARDLFLFQCYTGLAYSDLASSDYANCVEKDGKMFYHAKRTKTDTDFVFQLLSPAVEIPEKSLLSRLEIIGPEKARI